jgi:hypothetical protein
MRRKAQTRNRWRHNNAGRNGFRVRSLCLRPGMTNDEAIALHLTRFRVPHLICPSCQLAAPCPLAGRTRHTSPSPPSRAQQEGHIAIVTDVRTRGSDGREASATDDALALRTAKPCGPDAATLASSSWEASFLGMTVATKPVHRGELGISRKTIAQGMPDPFGEPVVTMLACFSLSHARLRVHRAPGIPCALRFPGGHERQTSCGQAAGSRSHACGPRQPGHGDCALFDIFESFEPAARLIAPTSKRVHHGWASACGSESNVQAKVPLCQ